MVQVYEKKNRSLVFSGSRKISTLGSTVQWETRQASLPNGTVDPLVGRLYRPHWTPMMDSNFLAYRIGISAIFTHVRNFYLTPLARAVPALGKDKKELTHVAPKYFCGNYFWLSM